MRDLNKRVLISALLCVPVSLLVASAVQAQAPVEGTFAERGAPQHGFYVESGGYAGAFSINLDRRFGQRFNVRLGVAYHDDVRYGVIPIGVSYIFGRDKLARNSHLEFGLGTNFWPGGEGIRRIVGAVMVASWRHQFSGSAWFYRISYHSEQDKVWPGLSLGYGF